MADVRVRDVSVSDDELTMALRVGVVAIAAAQVIALAPVSSEVPRVQASRHFYIELWML